MLTDDLTDEGARDDATTTTISGPFRLFQGILIIPGHSALIQGIRVLCLGPREYFMPAGQSVVLIKGFLLYFRRHRRRFLTARGNL